MASKLRLHADMMSQPCRAIVLMANKLAVPVEVHNVLIHKLQHKSPEFRKINPMGQVPALSEETPGKPVYNLAESTSILRYLCDAHAADAGHWYPNPYKSGLTSKQEIHRDLQQRAVIDSKLDWYHALMRPGAKEWAFYTVLGPRMGLPPNEYEADKGRKSYEKSLKIMSHWLSDAPFVAGDKISIADVMMACEITQLEVLPPGLWSYEMQKQTAPQVDEWFHRVKHEFGADWDKTHSVLTKAVAAFRRSEKLKA